MPNVYGIVDGVSSDVEYKSPRRRRAETKLLQAASELIAELGPEKVKLADIGERAGYSHGLATHHFGSKRGLIHRIIETANADFDERVARLDGDGSAIEQVRAVVAVCFDLLADPSPLHRARIAVWADAAAAGDPELRAAVLKMDDDFRDLLVVRLRTGVTNGEFPPNINPNALAALIISLVRGVALQLMLGDTVDIGACRAAFEHMVDSTLGCG